MGQVAKDVQADREFLLSHIATLRADMLGHWRLDEERYGRIEDHFQALERASIVALGVAKEATDAARVASEKRFDGVNEFRQTLSDQAATFVARSEYAAGHESLNDKVLALVSRLDRIQASRSGGQETQNLVVPWLVAAVSLMALVASIVIAVLKP